MAAFSVTVRRFSTPERIITVEADGVVVGNIAGWAFRWFVLFPREDVEDGVQLITITPTIHSAPNSQVKITMTAAHTPFAPGTYRGQLTWREDGTAPVWPQIPDDFMPLDLVIEEPAEVTP